MKTTKSLNNRVLLISIFVFLGNTFYVNAASVITGHVFNEKKQPLNYATATILNPETMKIVEGDMCNENGEFIIEDVKPGNYILSIRMLGFEKNETIKLQIDSLSKETKIENIVLKKSYQKLAEVVVTAKFKPTVQAPEKTFVSINKLSEPKSGFSINQFNFSSSYKSFMNLYDFKSLN